jgi:CRISPR-associated endonuclease Cas1
MAATQTVPQYLQHCNFAPITPSHGVITLAGYGINVRVDRGHLCVQDGIGPLRRAGRFPRVRHGIHRLIVIGADGVISLAALRWLAEQGAAFVMLERNGSVLATTGPVHPSDARLRRAQAVAVYSGTNVQIAKALIAAKLAGQERLARDDLNNLPAATAIGGALSALDAAESIDAIRRLEARAGLAYWSAWRNSLVKFPKLDLSRVPEHWQTFGARVSPISGSPRRACNPLNAVLNYLYAVLESESRLALATVGLDPGLGFLHLDSRTRDSLACDLMEPIRPEVDSYVLDWLSNRLFQRKDFFELPDGTCRLMAGLCAQLSKTSSTWAHAVAPWAELVARTLSATVRKPGRLLATPLTGSHRRAGRVGKHLRQNLAPPRPPRLCKICGASCNKTYCASCGRTHSGEEFDKGRVLAQSPQSRARRSATQKVHLHANRAWKPSKEFEWLDRNTYLSRVQPHLVTLKISALQSALGVSEPYAAFIGSGSRVPHPRHWPTLAKLVGVSQA